jgi:hypothetical protein
MVVKTLTLLGIYQWEDSDGQHQGRADGRVTWDQTQGL